MLRETNQRYRQVASSVREFVRQIQPSTPTPSSQNLPDLDRGEKGLWLPIVFPQHFALQFRHDPFQEARALQNLASASCE